MARSRMFQYVIVVGLVVMCGTSMLNAQIWFDGSNSKTNDSSNTRPVNEAPTTNH